MIVLRLMCVDSTALSRAPFGAGTGPIHLDDLRCTGSEGTLFDCPFAATHNCNHFEDAGVRCIPDGQYNITTDEVIHLVCVYVCLQSVLKMIYVW